MFHCQLHKAFLQVCQKRFAGMFHQRDNKLQDTSDIMNDQVISLSLEEYIYKTYKTYKNNAKPIPSFPKGVQYNTWLGVEHSQE